MSAKQQQKVQVLNVSFEKSQFDALMYALHDLTKAIASAQVKREGGTERNARFLKSFGLSESEIADVLGVTQPAVNMALKRKPKKARKESDDAVKEA